MSIIELSKHLIKKPYVCYNGDSVYFLYDTNDKLLRFKLTDGNENIEVLFVDNGFVVQNFSIKETKKLSMMNKIIDSFLDKR